MKTKLTLLLLSLFLSIGTWADGTWKITSTDLSTDGWTDMSGSVPAGVTALGSYTPYYRTENITVTQTGILTITFRYTTGYDQLVMLGVDLLDGDDNVVASDYHCGKSGNGQDANTYLVTAISTGSYKLRYIIHKDVNLDSSEGTITISKIVYADSYANITQWYNIRMHSNQTHYLKTNGSALSFTDAPDDTNNYLWAFVGNPTDGFQIYNYNYGSAKAIDNSSPCTFSAAGKSNALKLTGGRSGSSTSTKFCISMKNDGDYYNYQDDAIKRWSGNDEGSAFIIEEATPVSPVEGSTESAPIYYAWRTAVGNNPAYMYTEDGTPKSPNNTAPSFTEPVDAKYAWQFVGDAVNGFAIKNKATGTYLGGRTASGGAMSMEASATSYFMPIYNSATNNKWYCKNYNYYIDRSNSAPYAHTAGNNNDYIRLYNVKFSLSDAAAGLVVGSTTISDFSAYYLIAKTVVLSCETSGYVITYYDGYSTLAEALENDADGTITLTVAHSVNVTYNMMFNGNLITSTVVEEGIGGTASTPSNWNVPYCSFTCPATIITETPSPIEVTLDWNGPFAIASDYASATWHYVSIGGAWTVYNGSAIAAADSRKDAIEYGDGALWAFVGNPTSFKMYNKALGSSYKLNVGNNLVMSTSDTYAPLTITKVSDTTFYLANDGSFYLGYDETKDNKFPYVSPADSRALMTAITEYCGQAIEDVYTWAETQPVNTPFGINSSCFTTIENNFATLMSKMTQSEYEAISIPANISSSFVYVYPTTGYYRIKSSGFRGSPRYITGENGTKLVTTDTDGPGTVIKLTGTFPTYTMSVEGLNVQMFEAVYGAKATLGNAAGYNMTYEVIEPGYVRILNWYNTLYFQESGSYDVIGWSFDNRASYWAIEEAITVDISLNSDGAGTPNYYATLCLPFDVTISGANAYTLSKSGNYLVSTAVTDNKVPAGTPVLLKGTSATATATINSGAAFNSGTPLSCALTGTYVDLPVEKTDGISNDYYLGIKDSKVGFYKWSGTTLKANRAYLTQSAATEVKSFVLLFDDDDATGIASPIEETGEGSSIYNLSGQRVSKAQKGIFIVNGKKVLK